LVWYVYWEGSEAELLYEHHFHIFHSYSNFLFAVVLLSHQAMIMIRPFWVFIGGNETEVYNRTIFGEKAKSSSSRRRPT
jgi:hypothetical protein